MDELIGDFAVIVMQVGLFGLELVTWWLICRAMGVRFGEWRSFSRFLSGMMYVLICAFFYVVAGFEGVQIAAIGILALVALVASIWTLTQIIRAGKSPISPGSSVISTHFAPAGRRLIQNFFLTLIGLPLLLFEDASTFTGGEPWE